MLSGRGTLDTGPNLQGLMELAAAVGRAQNGGDVREKEWMT